MKASIVTIYNSNPNYGNRFQNYAIVMILKKIGIDSDTLVFENDIISRKQLIKAALQKIFKYKLPGDTFYWMYEIKRCKKFYQFNNKYINICKVGTMEKLKKLKSDFFIVGSDQVWNVNWYDSVGIKKNIYLLAFTESRKKVCFSPSFGIERLPDEWTCWFRKHLLDIPFISVREESGAKIVKELTGKDAMVLIDPTMMLDAEEWLKIAKQPENIESVPFIFTYFLGRKSSRINMDIEKYAQENKLQVYNLLDRDQPELYVSGPEEFIFLLSKAKLVLTDSFHACVFSFLFRKPFLVYKREDTQNNMMSRIDTLLKKFKLQRKFVDSGLHNELFECDYDLGYEILAKERVKVIEFLKKSMNLK